MGKMNLNQAKRLWDLLAAPELGESEDGGDRVGATKFGAVVLSHGLPQAFYELQKEEGRVKAAQFLCEWADALLGRNEEEAKG